MTTTVNTSALLYAVRGFDAPLGGYASQITQERSPQLVALVLHVAGI